jgi:outer membrane protein assembly factor BamB
VSNTGNTTATAPATNTTTWIFSADDSIWSSPAISDGKLYIGSNDRNLYCLDAEEGGLLWYYTADGFIGSTPAIVDGKLYVGAGTCCGGYDHWIHCFDADPSDDGMDEGYDDPAGVTYDRIWSYATDDYVDSSPAVVNEKVYIGSRDGNVYCLYALNGSRKWVFPTGGHVWSSPAVANGCVYIGSQDEDLPTYGHLYGLNAENGHELWSITTDGGETDGSGIQSSPAIVDGKVYVGSLNGNVYCFYAGNGTEKWRYHTDGVVRRSSPAIANGKLYIGSHTEDWPSTRGTLFCLDIADGHKVWNYSVEGEYSGGIDSSPAVADGKVYVGSENCKIYCLNAETGQDIWTYIAGHFVTSSPAIVNGRMYIGSDNGKVYCFGPGPDLECTGSLSWSRVKTGSTVTGYFTVKNIGETGSKLNWEIVEYPEWGDWTFTPSSGSDLTPEQGTIIVQVSVVAPDEKGGDFNGEIKIINTDDNSDYGTIPVVLSTPFIPHTFRSLMLQVLEYLIDRFPFVFPILRQLHDFIF